ncbi:MAG: hypothetical protein WCI74_05650, partial [Actinomycetes bacterium]
MSEETNGQNPWLAAVAATTIAITPDHSLDIAGLGSPAPVSCGVDDPLDCTALVISNAGVDPVMLVTLDLLYPGGVLRERLEAGLRPWLPPENLLVFASHTHAGPSTDPTKPRLGKVSPQYLRSLTDQVLDICTALLKQARTQATGRVFTADCDMAVNRRQRARVNASKLGLRFGVEVTGSDPDGPVDPSIISAVLRDAGNGEPLAVIWNYACHP